MMKCEEVGVRVKCRIEVWRDSLSFRLSWIRYIPSPASPASGDTVEDGVRATAENGMVHAITLGNLLGERHTPSASMGIVSIARGKDSAEFLDTSTWLVRARR